MAYKDKSRKTAYQNEFINRAYDRINLTVPKGFKETIQAHAADRGESVNAFINRAISEAMERDALEWDTLAGGAVQKSPGLDGADM